MVKIGFLEYRLQMSGRYDKQTMDNEKARNESKKFE